MKSETRVKVTVPTQDHLEIQDVMDDLALTKSGSVVLIMRTNAVNFDLLSEQEQDNKIYGFAGLLNSLNFHIQILIMTERIDISNYVDYLGNQLQREMSEGLRRQLDIYRHFIRDLIVTNYVLDKKFYIVIPYNPGGTAVVGAKLSKKQDVQEVITKEQKMKLFEQGAIFLYPKRDHVLKQLGRMGLMGHQLSSDEIIQLFYNTYNPEED